MANPQTGWVFELLGEVFERALRGGHLAEANRMLELAAVQVEVRLGESRALEGSTLAALSSLALRLAQAQGDIHWLRWVLGVHDRCAAMLSSELVAQLEGISSLPFRWAACRELASFLEHWRAAHAARATHGEHALAHRLSVLSALEAAAENAQQGAAEHWLAASSTLS